MGVLERNLRLLDLAKDYEVSSYDVRGLIGYEVKESGFFEENPLVAYYNPHEGKWTYCVSGVYNSGEDEIVIEPDKFVRLMEFTASLSEEPE